MDFTLILGIAVTFYILPILISIHVIQEFKLYVVDGTALFMPITNIFEMFGYLGEAVEKISKEARKEND